MFVCTATAANSVALKWKKTDGGTVKEFVVTTDYVTAVYADDGTQTSTLTLSGLEAADTSSTIECYDTDIGISAKVSLTVYGKFCTQILELKYKDY